MTLILADDDPLVTAALQTILQADDSLQVLGTAAGGAEAIDLYFKHRPDLALLDIRMGSVSGLDAAEAILSRDPEAKLLFLTTFSDDDYILRALRMGAMGYILKQDFDKIIPALHAAHAGQRVLGGEVVARLPQLMDDPGKKAAPEPLGLREREMRIIGLVAEGLSNREIAEAVFLSEGTVRNYISTILDKLDLLDRTQLAVFYYRNLK